MLYMMLWAVLFSWRMDAKQEISYNTIWSYLHSQAQGNSIVIMIISCVERSVCHSRLTRVTRVTELLLDITKKSYISNAWGAPSITGLHTQKGAHLFRYFLSPISFVTWTCGEPNPSMHEKNWFPHGVEEVHVPDAFWVCRLVGC